MSLLVSAIASSPWWREPSTVFGGVIAATTLAYVICTIALWRSTKRAANAAMISAEAAMKSADAAAEMAAAGKRSVDVMAGLHRPFMGISRLRIPDRNTRIWRIVLSIRNYGTLPAMNVGVFAEYYLNGLPLGSTTDSSSTEIFPGTEFDYLLEHTLNEQDYQLLMSGNEILIIRVRITYGGPDNRPFEYAAEVQCQDDVFSIISSQTRSVQKM
jgi:hypothetical protein